MQIGDLFTLCQDDGYLIYSPENFALIKVTAGLLDKISKLPVKTEIMENELSSNYGFLKQEIALLVKCGIFMKQKEMDEINPPKMSYIPSLTLFPTSKCNLACIYCFARGGEKQQDMPFIMAKDAVDYVFNQLPQKQALRLSIHGNGEPTQNFVLMKQIVQYCEDLCSRCVRELHVSLSTNGVFSNDTLQWILRHISSLQISLDGMPDIQDQQRPTKYQGKSSKITEYTIRELATSMRVHIRSTITSSSVKRMEAIYKYICSLGINSIQVEPFMVAGRAIDNLLKPVDPDEFFYHFMNCVKLSEMTKVPISCFVGSNVFRKKMTYCGATENPFVLTPDGFISACYEGVEISAPTQDNFIIGKYQPKKHSFFFYEDKLRRLRMRRLNNLPKCQNCIAKYSCSGGCIYHHYKTSGDFLGYDDKICQQVKRIFSAYLQRIPLTVNSAPIYGQKKLIQIQPNYNNLE